MTEEAIVTHMLFWAKSYREGQSNGQYWLRAPLGMLQDLDRPDERFSYQIIRVLHYTVILAKGQKSPDRQFPPTTIPYSH